MDQDLEPIPETSPLIPIRVETALSRYPVHRLARKGTIDINIVNGHGSAFESRWEVDFSKKHGQPGPLAYKLDTLIINRRIEEAGRPLNRLLKLGSLSEIAKELELADSGKNREHIKKALYQNAFAGITVKTQYKLADKTIRTLESGFTRYSIILTGEELPSGKKADAVHIILNDVFMQVINGAMTRPLDYEYLKSLPPAAQRFYELLSYQMYATLKYDRPRAKLTYSELCAHAPQTRHLNWNAVRSQMHKVHRPHRQSGYIADVKFQETTDADGNVDWLIFYMPGPKARAEFLAFKRKGGPSVLEIEPLNAPLAIPSPAPPSVEAELVGRGITAKVAQDVALKHAEEKILFQLECLDWQMERNPKKISDPAAYLISAIENDFAAPKRFVSKAEQERQAEKKRQADNQEAETRRLERAAEAKAKAIAAKVAAYRETLTTTQLAQLEADAIAQADENVRQMLSMPHMKNYRSTQISLLVNEHIERLLEAEPIATELA